MRTMKSTLGPLAVLAWMAACGSADKLGAETESQNQRAALDGTSETNQSSTSELDSDEPQHPRGPRRGGDDRREGHGGPMGRVMHGLKKELRLALARCAGFETELKALGEARKQSQGQPDPAVIEPLRAALDAKIAASSELLGKCQEDLKGTALGQAMQAVVEACKPDGDARGPGKGELWGDRDAAGFFAPDMHRPREREQGPADDALALHQGPHQRHRAEITPSCKAALDLVKTVLPKPDAAAAAVAVDTAAKGDSSAASPGSAESETSSEMATATGTSSSTQSE